MSNSSVYVYCPNCHASFEVSPQRLPAPKFNGSYQAFGWKFECGNCDTQWWVCLTHPDTTPTPLAQPRPYPFYDPLADLTHPSPRPVPHFPNRQAHMKKSWTKTVLDKIPLPFRAHKGSKLTSPYAPLSTHTPASSRYFSPPNNFAPASPYREPTQQRASTKLYAKPHVHKHKRSALRWLIYLLLPLACLLVSEHFFPNKINEYMQNFGLHAIDWHLLNWRNWHLPSWAPVGLF